MPQSVLTRTKQEIITAIIKRLKEMEESKEQVLKIPSGSVYEPGDFADGGTSAMLSEQGVRQEKDMQEFQKQIKDFQSLPLTPAKTVEVGSLVQIQDGKRNFVCLLLPFHCPSLPEFEGIQLISTKSPVGRAILGMEKGTVATAKIPAGTQNLRILFVA